MSSTLHNFKSFDHDNTVPSYNLQTWCVQLDHIKTSINKNPYGNTKDVSRHNVHVSVNTRVHKLVEEDIPPCRFHFSQHLELQRCCPARGSWIGQTRAELQRRSCQHWAWLQSTNTQLYICINKNTQRHSAIGVIWLLNLLILCGNISDLWGWKIIPTPHKMVLHPCKPMTNFLTS